jgi:hypothetical protein
VTDVPDVLAALVDVFAPVAPDGMKVNNGMLYDFPANGLTVGWAGEEGQAAADVTSVPLDAGQISFRDVYDVPCCLTLHIGKKDTAAVQTAAAAVLVMLRTAIRTATFQSIAAGLMRPPYLSRQQWQPAVLDEGGTNVTVYFWVHIETQA